MPQLDKNKRSIYNKQYYIKKNTTPPITSNEVQIINAYIKSQNKNDPFLLWISNIQLINHFILEKKRSS